MGANGSYGEGSGGNTPHTHPIGEIDYLTTQLNLKAPLIHTHTLSSLQDVPTPQAGKIFKFKEDGTGYEWVDVTTGTPQYTIPEKPTLAVSLINNIVTLAITLGGNGGLDITSIKIRRMTTDAFAEIFTTTPNMLTISDDTALADTTYRYEVIAVNPIGDSIPSDIKEITTPTISIPNDWFDNSWNKRIALTIQSNQVPSTQTNFPMLVNSTFDGLIGKSINEIRFALTDKTELNYEIQEFDSIIGKLIAWVKIPSIDDGTNVLLYYGNNSAVDNPNPNAVWSGYSNIYHMNQIPNGQNSIQDSTVNTNHATPTGTLSVDGKIGKTLSFDGIDDMINASPIDTMGNFTASMMINPDSLAGSGHNRPLA